METVVKGEIMEDLLIFVQGCLCKGDVQTGKLCELGQADNVRAKTIKADKNRAPLLQDQ